MTPTHVDSESEDEGLDLTEQHMTVLEPVVETCELDSSGMFKHTNTVKKHTNKILSEFIII